MVNSTCALRTTNVLSLLNISRINTIQRPNNLHKQFVILRKLYHRKFECLIYQMLLTRKMRLCTHTHTHTQKDSISAKLFFYMCPKSIVALHVTYLVTCFKLSERGIVKVQKVYSPLKEIKICQVPSCVDF